MFQCRLRLSAWVGGLLNLYGQMLALSGISGFIATWIRESGMGLYAILAIYLVIVLLMGTILDSTSIMMIIVPLMYPIMSDMVAKIYVET